MILLSGVGILAITLLAFSWAYGVFRRPAPGAWTETEGAATAVCLVLTALVAASLGFSAQAVVQIDTVLAETGPAGYAAALAILAAAVPLSRRLSAPARKVRIPDMRTVIGMPADLPAPANSDGAALRGAA